MMKSIRFYLSIVLFCCTAFTAACQENAQKPDPGKSKPSPGSQVNVTFIELGSVNCIPCRAMQLIMKDIEREFGDQVRIVFHDVWTEAGRPYAVLYRIKVVPTQVFLDQNGKEYFRHEGYFPKEELIKILKQKGVR